MSKFIMLTNCEGEGTKKEVYLNVNNICSFFESSMYPGHTMINLISQDYDIHVKETTEEILLLIKFTSEL